MAISSDSGLPPAIEVCIVGAGPSGLACALGLAARRIPFVIVDALAGGHNGSRAICMHSAALESLGAVDSKVSMDLVASGTRCSITLVDRHDQLVARMSLTDHLQAYTQFPFALSIQQHIVEHTIRAGLERAGHRVHFNKRVCSINQVAGGSEYQLEFESGETVKARYVVAADGAKSFLRSVAGISLLDPFTNKAPTYDDVSFIVADVVFEKLSTWLPRDELQVRLGDDGFVLTGPLRDASLPEDLAQNLFRVYVGMSETPPSHPDIKYLQGILDARGPGSASTPRQVPRIAKVLHSARYRTQNGLADKYVHAAAGGAYILLVGDAAHTHGPAGGQGMNLGICDGCELAQAIDEHRTGDDARTLEGYSTRRRAVARQVISLVATVSEVEKGEVSWVAWLRLKALFVLTRLGIVNGLVAWNISGLGRIQKGRGSN